MMQIFFEIFYRISYLTKSEIVVPIMSVEFFLLTLRLLFNEKILLIFLFVKSFVFKYDYVTGLTQQKCLYIFVHTYVDIYLYIYICMCVCITLHQ